MKHVSQANYNGCFVAAIAMLLGKTYEQAFKLLHPGKSVDDADHGFNTNFIAQTLTELLEKHGYKVKQSTYKRVKSLPRYSKKNALLIVRWGGGMFCHCVAFDAETKQFMDPSGMGSHTLRTYQRNLDSMYYVEAA
jgi:hypothetical protein